MLFFVTFSRKIMKILKNLLLLVLIIFASTQNTLADDNRKFYIGTGVGASAPGKQVISDPDTESILDMSKAQMFGFSAGYEFYPGMAIEASYSHQPSFDFHYEIFLEKLVPEDFLSLLKNTVSGDAVQSKVDSFMINLVYKMPPQYFAIQPYFMAGIGVARMKFGPTVSNITFITDEQEPIFKMLRNKPSCVSYHFGVGAIREVTKRLSVDFSVRMQALQSVKFKFQALNADTLELEAGTKRRTPILIQFMLGVQYKL